MPRKKKEIVAMIKQAREQALTTLDLANCPLSEFIVDVCALTSLEELNLTHCHLSALPDEIGNLTNLKKLILAENHMQTLPETITRLSKLSYLDLTLCGIEQVSETVVAWITGIENTLLTHTELEKRFETPPFVLPEDPKTLLKMLKDALADYGTANDMEDRTGNGWDKRQEADKKIAEIFKNVPELKGVLPDFYQDFQTHSFYSFSQQSEKHLKRNPFKLPTQKDEKWLAEYDRNSPSGSYRLSAKTRDYTQVLRVLGDGFESVITPLTFGEVLISNQPYAEDVTYSADFAAWLYRAGEARFYLELCEVRFSDVISWYVSEDGGKSWSSVPYFLHDFLDREHSSWILLSSISKG